MPSASGSLSVSIPSVSEYLQFYYSIVLCSTSHPTVSHYKSRLTAHYLPSLYYLLLIFCPYQLPPTPYFRQLLFMLTVYGVHFRRCLRIFFDWAGRSLSELPRVAAHLMLWTRGDSLLAMHLMRRRFVSRACSFRI